MGQFVPLTSPSDKSGHGVVWHKEVVVLLVLRRVHSPK